jgi:hypothetical protein
MKGKIRSTKHNRENIPSNQNRGGRGGRRPLQQQAKQ